MSVAAILSEVQAAGIALRLDGARIRMWFPNAQRRERAAEQIAFLRSHIEEVAKLLQARNGEAQARSPFFWGARSDGRARDYYGWRAHVALDAICKIHAPKGLIVWLSQYSPLLYRRLTQDLPDQISCAWESRIPTEEFDALCLDLVSTFRRAANLFQE